MNPRPEGNEVDKTTMLSVILFLGGFALLTFGIREVLVQRQLWRDGIRVWGTVVRHNSQGGGQAVTAVVGFTDADGRWGEVESSSTGGKWPVGHRVPVVRFDGTARVDLGAERWLRSFALWFAGALFVLVPIAILILRTG